MRLFKHMIQNNSSVSWDPDDFSKGSLVNSNGLLTYKIYNPTQYTSGKIKISEIKSVHYEVSSNLNIRTIAWSILGLILAILVYFSIDPLTSKIMGITICFALIGALIFFNSSQSNKSHIVICYSQSEIIFPIKKGSKRKKEIIEFISKLLENPSSENPSLNQDVYYQDRVLQKGPTTPFLN